MPVAVENLGISELCESDDLLSQEGTYPESPTIKSHSDLTEISPEPYFWDVCLLGLPLLC